MQVQTQSMGLPSVQVQMQSTGLPSVQVQTQSTGLPVGGSIAHCAKGRLWSQNTIIGSPPLSLTS